MTEDKKTAALGPSVGADGGQLVKKNEHSIPEELEKGNPYPEKTEEEMAEILRRLEQAQDPNFLQMMNLEALMDRTFPVREEVIGNLLHKGVYIFAGAPKIGKSFLVLQLAYAISTGQPFCGYQVKQGAVLYLALEDQYQRLQSRMARMFGVDGQADLLLAVSAKQIGQGLEGQLEFFLKQYPGAQLIIIDTLQKIRELAGEHYSYAGDYDIMGQLKGFADSHNICLLVVHHTRKQQAGDSFEMISGTTGLLGCADGAFLMHKEKRTDNRVVLEIVGRDQPDQRLHLIRNEENLTWELEEADCTPWKEPPDPLLEQISQLVTPEQPVWSGTATDLVGLLGNQLTPIGVVKRLNARANRLYSDYGIRYETSRSHGGRSLSLTRLQEQA